MMISDGNGMHADSMAMSSTTPRYPIDWITCVIHMPSCSRICRDHEASVRVGIAASRSRFQRRRAVEVRARPREIVDGAARSARPRTCIRSSWFGRQHEQHGDERIQTIATMFTVGRPAPDVPRPALESAVPARAQRQHDRQPVRDVEADGADRHDHAVGAAPQRQQRTPSPRRSRSPPPACDGAR